jgi:predicted metal-dependent hydrolase
VGAAGGFDPVVADGVTLFNRGRYLDAHQRWEAFLPEAAGDQRVFLEGLIQLATGLHLRTQRGGTRGSEHLIARALVSFEDFRPAAHGLDVDRLVAEFGVYLDWLRAVRRPHRALDVFRIPRLHRL